MLIKNEFEVAEPVEKVWQFFDNIPQVAACLPGAELTEDLGDDKYKGKVAVTDGPGAAAVRRDRRHHRARRGGQAGGRARQPARTRRAAARPAWS